MKALTFESPYHVAVKNVSNPQIIDDTDAIIRVTRSAVCGSDLHVYHGRIAGVEPGFILGHEYVGVVEETGKAVKRLGPGMRVTGSFFTSCGQCETCCRGWYSHCVQGQLFGFGSRFGNLAGTQAEWARIPWADGTLYPLPEDITDDQGVLAGDIISTAYFATSRAHIRAGDTVAVIGCGPVGLIAIQMAFVFGACRVIAGDQVPERLEIARHLGADPLLVDENARKKLLELTGGHEVDAVIEAVGSSVSLNLATKWVRPYGHITAAGVYTENALEVPMGRMFAKDLTLASGMANVIEAFNPVIQLLRHGRIHIEPVISHHFTLDEGPHAYQLFDQKKTLKVLLTP